MKRSTVIATLGILVLSGRAFGQQQVKIYLPRQLVLAHRALTVGDVAIVACQDEALQAKVKAVAVGRGPLSSETLRVDRMVILSRLATAGIDRSRVSLTGAQQVQVRRPETRITAEDILEEALEALDAKAEADGEEKVQWQKVNEPEDLVIPKVSGARLRGRVDKSGPGYASLVVEVISEDTVLGSQTVEFRKIREVKRLVAKRDIPPGVPLTSNNTEYKTFSTSGRSVVPPAALGQITRSRIAKGRAVTQTMVRDFQAAPVVRKKQPVVMRIEGETFEIQAAGVALQDGRAGDLIQVRNIDSSQVIIAKVMADGSVAPVIER
jgi:flagella basal body P-ring formation protein FlgA